MNATIKKIFEEIDSILSVNSDGEATLDIGELHKIEEKYMKEDTDNWTSASEELPKESGDYLTTDIELGGHARVLHYSKVHKLFNAFDEQSHDRVIKYALPVSHWMPVPELPKKGGKR